MSSSHIATHSDRSIPDGTIASKSRRGAANALWRYEKQRRRNLLATPGPHTVTLVLDGLHADFNVPKIFRSAEALGAHSIHLINIGAFDPAPSKGAFKRVPAHFYDNFGACREQLLAADFTLIALDPHAHTLISNTPLPKRCAFILGAEAQGLSAEAKAGSIQQIKLPQWGQTESLNVSIAASIALYEYTRQWGQPAATA